MRDRILAATLRQMNMRGIKFTTADLARELGVSKRAIYLHFSSKEALVAAVLDSILTDLRQQITGIVGDDSLDTIERVRALMILYPKAIGPVNMQVIEDVKRFLPHEWAKFEKCFEERWRMLEKIIDEGTKKGALTKVDLVILNKVYMGTINQLLDYQFLAQNNITFRNAMTKAAEILIGGLTAPSYRNSDKIQVAFNLDTLG